MTQRESGGPSDGFWCLSCGEQGLLLMREGEVCQLCGEESREPFRVGWDESD